MVGLIGRGNARTARSLVVGGWVKNMSLAGWAGNNVDEDCDRVMRGSATVAGVSSFFTIVASSSTPDWAAKSSAVKLLPRCSNDGRKVRADGRDRCRLGPATGDAGVSLS